MKPELKAKVDAVIASVAEKKEKASDLDVIITAISKLPPGQLKKVLTDEVIAVLAKYGVTFE